MRQMARPTWLQRMTVAAVRMVFPGAFGASDPGSIYRLLLPGTQLDWEREAGDLWRNSVVASCIGWAQRAFPEARLRVVRDEAGEEKPVLDHPLTRLVACPNPFYSGNLLWQATLLSWLTDGNAYWLKSRGAGGMGLPMQLWYVPHYSIAPAWPSDGSEYISHYHYRVDGKTIKLPREDVVHFRFGIDPHNERLGLSPLKAAIREVCTDNEASTYSAALLRNMGVSGLAIRPKDSTTTISEDQAAVIRASLSTRYTGDNRGKALILDAPVEIEKLAFSPEELALDKLRQVPEDRITAALGIPAMVVGITSGAAHKTYANYHEAREAAYEGCIVPTQAMFAQELMLQLLPDFEVGAGSRVDWDYSRVRVLQDDQDKLWQRVTNAFSKGLISRGEGKRLLSLKFKPEENEIYATVGGAGEPDDGRDDDLDRSEEKDRDGR